MVQKARTKLDEEKQFKKEQAEAGEFLDAITETGEKGEIQAAELITEKEKIAEKETEEDKIRKIEELEKSRRFTRKEYIFKLATLCSQMVKHVDFPLGYTYWIGYNEEKMNIIITGKDGKKFGRGIKPVGIPMYDLHAVGVLLTQCENTIDKLEERGAYNKSGIILPN